MKTRTISIIILLIIIAIIVAGWVYLRKPNPISPAVTPAQSGTEVSYMCNDNKTIQATFYQGETKPSTSPDQPPQPGGSVHVVLSDGRDLTLQQTISADGVRSANADGSFVFWSKGNGALVLENNEQKSYIGCVQVKSDPGGLPQVYENGSDGFSLRYPTGYTVDPNYKYQALGPGKDISGVKFTIPQSMATGTNLAADSYVSVEELPNPTGKEPASCTADRFLDHGSMMSPAQTVTEDGTTYSVATSSGAGAGNRYEETVYAMPGTNPCVAVRYFVHYGVIENYPPGKVKEFDMSGLLKQFDSIRKTLTISQ